MSHMNSNQSNTCKAIFLKRGMYLINTVLTCFSLVDAAPISMRLTAGLFLSASNCAATQEEKDDMVGKLYRELVSMLSWLALGSHPDIVFVTGTLTHFDHNLGCAHWEAAKCVLCYLKGTRGWHLMLGGNQLEVSAYTEADWGNDRDDRHSIGAYIIKVSGGAVSWKSKKHTCVTLSSTEAEYVALCQAALDN